MEVERIEGNAPTILSIKRKAEEAFDALDEALEVRPKQRRPSPVKNANVSFYSSLTRHGIVTKPITKPSVSTPTLSALLNRARSKKDIRSTPFTQSSKMPSIIPEYSPGSTEAFLERLSTFSVSTYPSKPQPIDAVAAAMTGWINEGGKNRLFCSICHAGWIIAGRDGLSKEAADALVEKQAGFFITNHKEGCPWRARQCDPLVYRVPLQSPANLAKQVKGHADELEPLMESIVVRHPLSNAQVNSFVAAVTAVISKPSQSSSISEDNHENTSITSSVKIPSTTSLLTALFGWTLVPLPVQVIRKSSAVSLAHARNLSLSRAASVVQSTSSREGTPAPSVDISSHPSTPVRSQFPPPPPSPSTLLDTSVVKRPSAKDATLQCKLCQRRIGLWAFTAATTTTPTNPPDSPYQPNGPQPPQRQLDLIREHRSYCPYVVKSTPLATLPSYDSGKSQPETTFSLTRADTSVSEKTTATGFQKPALFRSATIFSMGRHLPHGRSNSVPSSLPNLPLVEGWRAVLNTILRYGISERVQAQAADVTTMRHSADAARPREFGTEALVFEVDEDDPMKGVTKIVEDVKRHGGKQILGYIRNLLG